MADQIIYGNNNNQIIGDNNIISFNNSILSLTHLEDKEAITEKLTLIKQQIIKEKNKNAEKIVYHFYFVIPLLLFGIVSILSNHIFLSLLFTIPGAFILVKTSKYFTIANQYNLQIKSIDSLLIETYKALFFDAARKKQQ
jgi:hypothetical protein